MYVIMKIS